jgi:Fe2+ or Zn2+ uptake regulation protein
MNNRRNTRQRDLILEIVRTMRSHPSADEVYAVAKHSLPSISMGTVYRNLRLLVEEKHLKEVRIGGNASRFDAILDEHEHFHCDNCGKLIDIPTGALTTDLTNKQELAGCSIKGYTLQIHGLCPDCAVQG